MSGPLNSSKPTTSIPVAGVYNQTQPAPANQQAVALQVDDEGNLLVNVAVGGGGGGGTVKIEDTSGNALNSNGSGALQVAVVSGAANDVTVVGPLGSQISANSVSVVVASDQSAIANNVSEWGGTAVDPAATTAAVGTEAAPVTRPIQRKSGAILTTTPLAANGVYTSAWFDTNQTGAIVVIAHSVTNVISASSGFIIVGSDDQSTLITLATFPNTSTGNAQLSAQINTRYYRVQYTNGGTLQTSFSLSIEEYSFPSILQLIPNPSSNGGVFPVSVLFNSAVTDGVTVDKQYDSAGTSGISAAVGSSVTSGVATSNVMNRQPNNFAEGVLTTGTSVSLVSAVSAQKWRLMKYRIQVTGLAAISGGGGDIKISLQDGGTSIPVATYYVSIPTVASSGAANLYDTGWVDLGFIGYVSSGNNQALTLAIGTALTAGTVNAIVGYCGPATTV